jgi:hypothetical protein
MCTVGNNSQIQVDKFKYDGRCGPCLTAERFSGVLLRCVRDVTDQIRYSKRVTSHTIFLAWLMHFIGPRHVSGEHETNPF